MIKHLYSGNRFDCLVKSNYGFDLTIGSAVLSCIINDPFVDQKHEFQFLPHNHCFYELQLVLDGPALSLIHI